MSALLPVLPLAFVLMWSTGHVMSRLGIPYIDPFHFLTIRFAVSAALMTLIAALARARWPDRPAEIGHAVVAGLLVHACYLGGVFVAIDLRVGAGTLAVVTGMQPLLTAILAGPYLGERVTRRQWAGLVLGVVGVALVVWEKISVDGTLAAGFAAALVALAAITLGTLYQKKHDTGLDLRSTNAIQLAVAAVACLVLTLALETRAADWTAELYVAMGWQIVVLSVVSFWLLYYLLRHGEAVRVASLFYLAPPATALMSYLLFGETFARLGIAGIGIAVLGFWLVNRRGGA